jgi:hypothetical protein
VSDFTPSAAQAAAIAEVRDWFENRTEEQQVFRLFVYAGSGKSTVLKFALDDLGLSSAMPPAIPVITRRGRRNSAPGTRRCCRRN